MAAPPPGADVQRRHRPTAAGLAVTEGSLRAPFPADDVGETLFSAWGKPCFPHEPPSSASWCRDALLTSRASESPSGRYGGCSNSVEADVRRALENRERLADPARAPRLHRLGERADRGADLGLGRGLEYRAPLVGGLAQR